MRSKLSDRRLALVSRRRPAAPSPSAPLKEQMGGVVGTIDRVEGGNLVLKTDRHDVTLPVSSFTATDEGALFGMTRDQLYAEVDKAKAASDAQIVAGATVKGAAGAVVGTIEAVDAQFVTLKLASGTSIRLPRSAIAGGPDGPVTGMTAEQVEAAPRRLPLPLAGGRDPVSSGCRIPAFRGGRLEKPRAKGPAAFFVGSDAVSRRAGDPSAGHQCRGRRSKGDLGGRRDAVSASSWRSSRRVELRRGAVLATCWPKVDGWSTSWFDLLLWRTRTMMWRYVAADVLVEEPPFEATSTAAVELESSFRRRGGAPSGRVGASRDGLVEPRWSSFTVRSSFRRCCSSRRWSRSRLPALPRSMCWSTP